MSSWTTLAANVACIGGRAAQGRHVVLLDFGYLIAPAPSVVHRFRLGHGPIMRSRMRTWRTWFR